MSAVASSVPPVITPVVVIALAPLSMLPNPLVILPLSSAPVVTMFELPAAGAADMSDSTSDADRPSMAVPATRKKSSSATPLVNFGTLLLDIPVSSVAVAVIAVPLSVIASASSVPSISASPLMSSDPASNSPVSVTLRKLAMSLLLSTMTALDAVTVPAVTPSMASNSASVMTAPDPSVRSPPTVRWPATAVVLLATVLFGVCVR